MPFPRCRLAPAAWLAAAALLPALAAAPAAGGKAVPLRVMTYNVHAGIGADGRLDLDRTAAAIRASGAGIVALQEVDVHWSARSNWADQARELARRLGMQVRFAPIATLQPPEPGAPPRQFGLAVLSRHPILHAENHHITRLPTQEPGPVPAPAPGFPELVVNVRGVRLHVYATHLDFRPDPAVRAMQVRDMLAVTGQDPAPKVLLGDFNASPQAAELAPLWGPFRDAWALAGTGAGWTFPAHQPDRRIDYVTASPDVRVVGARVPATLASDHLPVVADLLLPRRHG